MAPLDDLLNDVFQDDALLRAVLSKPRSADLPRKVTVEPVDLRDENAFQFTSQLADRVIHDNLAADAARERLGLLLADYGQGLLQTADADWQVLGETVLRRPPTRAAAPRDHDRRKQYLLEEGTPVPFLVELGVMTPDGKVRSSHYDKFRQVNRFLELVDDIVPSLRTDGTLRVVDFGCGKSYLTFAIHHLLTELRGRELEIVGSISRRTSSTRARRSQPASARRVSASSRGTSPASTRARRSTSSSASTPATPPLTRRWRRRFAGRRT